MRDEIKNIANFIKKHKKIIILIFLLALLTYFVKIFNYSISIDTEVNTNSSTANDMPWMATGRWTLHFLGKIVHYQGVFNPFVSNFIMILFLSSSVILLSYLMDTIFKKEKVTNNILITLSLIIITSPCIAEMLNFTLMTAEVSFALFCTVFSVYSTYIAVFQKKKLFYLFAITSLIIAMGTYQAFYPLYIGLIAFIYAASLISKDNLELKEKILNIIKILTVFLLSYFLNSTINKLLMNHYGLSESGYLTNQILWGKSSSDVIITNIKEYMNELLFAKNSIFFTKVYLFATILAIISCISMIYKKKSKSILIVLSLIIAFLSPFLLCILVGDAPANRTQFCLPFITGLFITLFICLFKNKKLQYTVLAITLFFAFSQYKTTSDFFYNDYARYKEDVRLTQDIMNKIDMLENLEKNREEMPIVFLGKYSPKSSSASLKGETFGYSFYEWDQATVYGSNIRINGFANTIGYHYILPKEKEVKKAKQKANELEVYPKKDSIKIIDDMIIVRLS